MAARGEGSVGAPADQHRHHPPGAVHHGAEQDGPLPPKGKAGRQGRALCRGLHVHLHLRLQPCRHPLGQEQGAPPAAPDRGGHRLFAHLPHAHLLPGAPGEHAGQPDGGADTHGAGARGLQEPRPHHRQGLRVAEEPRAVHSARAEDHHQREGLAGRAAQAHQVPGHGQGLPRGDVRGPQGGHLLHAARLRVLRQGQRRQRHRGQEVQAEPVLQPVQAGRGPVGDGAGGSGTVPADGRHRQGRVARGGCGRHRQAVQPAVHQLRQGQVRQIIRGEQGQDGGDDAHLRVLRQQDLRRGLRPAQGQGQLRDA